MVKMGAPAGFPLRAGLYRMSEPTGKYLYSVPAEV